jgi:uncharacterized protein (DUF111 family)
MAGDMFTAALVSAGADFKNIQEAMQAAGRKLGCAQIELKQAPDGASQLSIKLDSNRHRLGGKEAVGILTDLFRQFDIREKYKTFGEKTLDILIKAEIKAHKEFNIVVEGDHTHHHSHSHDHDHDHSHSRHTHHRHTHENAEESFLHEAQDIVIDIMGAVTGMQLLDIEPEADLLAPVSVGGGFVVCSHGRLSIPAPATTVILRESGIPWEKGPIDVELFTPTGAAILATLGSPLNESASLAPEAMNIKATGTARGTKMLEIPPLKIFLVG